MNRCGESAALSSAALLLGLLASSEAAAYVDPIFADGYDPFACSASDNPQPNVAIATEAGSGGCPDGMVPVDSFCIDRYEAALIDDSPGNTSAPWSPYFNPGTTPVHAVSARFAVPQGYISQVQAGAACAAAGKRLCTDSEWLRACRGPDATTYPFGNDYVAGTCNDTRAVNPVVELHGSDSSQWTFADFNDPCLDQLPQGLTRAGNWPACVSAEGVYDLMGNLLEWTADPAGTFRGGDYVNSTINGNGCLYVTTAHDALYHDYSTGFRCCSDAPPAPMARAGSR